ncbi:HCL380Cp [Eremothecium sinecaudum]|uniref:HCL380Cp n=1 Tax=Eremothecium sinecaudum TaxID=45286 RepID=A0A120K1W5_9SACH|nr:HCL380Cp [Eremothecium sinecaudum]AMD19771.1 HCL380Cp [Eremothecium sinecaudum]
MKANQYESRHLSISDAHKMGPMSISLCPLRTPEASGGSTHVPPPLIPPLLQQRLMSQASQRQVMVPSSYALRQSSPQVTNIMGELTSLKNSLYQSLNGELTTEEYNSIYQHLAQLLASLPPPVEASPTQPHTRLPSISQVIAGNEQQDLQQQTFIISSKDIYNHAYISPPVSSTLPTMPVSSEVSVQSTQNTGGRRNACKVCGRECRRPSTLKTHMLTHTGQRPFRCRFPGCNKSFNVRSNMLRHERLHDRNGEMNTTKTSVTTATTNTTANETLA